jgi:hypothetical protein
MAARFDPLVAVTTSDVDPLPHQIKAVYGDLLPRTPLRFLLTDDPGAEDHGWASRRGRPASRRTSGGTTSGCATRPHDA